MSDILVVGSINMDTVMSVDHIPEVGETIIAKKINYFFGGKGANQAVAASRLGGRIHIIGKIGNDDIGDKLYKNLKENNIDVSMVEIDKSAPSGTAMINVDGDGRNNIVIVQGTNAKVDIAQVDKNLDAFDKAQYCIVQLEIPFDTVKHTIDICDKKGVKVIFNPAPARSIPDDVLKKVYMITPNEIELSEITGMSTNTLEEIESASRFLLKKGVKNVITTLGEKGSLLVNESTCKHYSPVCVKAVDTTGAGDSYTAAVAEGLSENMTLDEAIGFATHVSALAVTKEGAQSSLPYRKEVDEFIKLRSKRS